MCRICLEANILKQFQPHPTPRSLSLLWPAPPVKLIPHRDDPAEIYPPPPKQKFIPLRGDRNHKGIPYQA